jgi:hypothetical protein
MIAIYEFHRSCDGIHAYKSYRKDAKHLDMIQWSEFTSVIAAITVVLWPHKKRTMKQKNINQQSLARVSASIAFLSSKSNLSESNLEFIDNILSDSHDIKKLFLQL